MNFFSKFLNILDAFAKLRKATISVITICQSVRLSTRLPALNTSASTGRTLVKFDIRVFFENL